MTRSKVLNAIVTEAIPGGFTAIAGAFVVESLQHMIPWLIVTCAVILCDLAAGCRRAMVMNEKFRISRAVRATMGKMVTYFSFVVMVCMVNVAAGNAYKIEVYSCLLVCFIEGCSIIGNVLKPKGYDFNLFKAFALLGKKVLKVEKEDMEGIITKDKEGKDNESD